MPLTGNCDIKPTFHPTLNGIAFGMFGSVNNATLQVRVVVTLQALAQFANAPIDTPPVALECFESFRNSFELAASAKFDRINLRIEKFEGVATFMLLTGDPI